MNNTIKTTKQQQILDELSNRFGIEPERILFINPRDANDPWIPPDELMSIARQHGGFKLVSVTHDKFISETAQQIYTATVVDRQDRTFVRSGVAMIGEKPNDFDIDADTLASGRALGAALRDAGFHPYRSGSVVSIDEARTAIEGKKNHQEIGRIGDEAALRTKDLQQIHAIAEKKGLIVGKDYTAYRERLFEKFGARTAAILGASERAAVVNWLNNLDEWSDIPSEYRDDALVA